MPSLDFIVTCPYERSHRIRKSVLPYHMVKCRRNHPSTKLLQCPFDALHVIDEKNFEDHMTNCPSSANIKTERYILEPRRELGLVPLESIKDLAVAVMKDWPEDYVPPYDPWKNTENRNIIRCLIGQTKSKKKQFKLAERTRMQSIEGNGIFNPNLKHNFKQKTSKPHLNISHLIRNLRRLTLGNIDTLIASIDMGKLIISDVTTENTFVGKKYIPEMIEKVLVERFKELMLHCIEKEIL